ncbi:MAG: FemAB family PEP-CTERM system-associated protein [Gemmataceae bacterium]|nr:FemAB family PEP-CTERM system-associated protein [Gemmataceae bacterium]
MTSAVTNVSSSTVQVATYERDDLPDVLPRLSAYATEGKRVALSRHPAWLNVLQEGLRHGVYCLEAVENGRTRGFLSLAFVKSMLFGRFLVSLPYLNTGGVVADSVAIQQRLIDGAIRLADDLRVRYLELRHEQAVEHPALTERLGSKAHMRLALPSFVGQLWKQLSCKVRNQVRKAQKNELRVTWGGEETLSDFYSVFSQNMRDLGTPVYGRHLFQQVLRQFPDRAEVCVVRAGDTPVAAALLLHGWGVTEVPSAACLRQYNASCANMLLYWHLLERAVLRQHDVFDFGRSTVGGNTYRFKKQWGAEPEAAVWQYYVREGSIGDMRPENPRYQRAIRMWQKLPVAVTCWIGPSIVRGIP